MRSQWEGSQWEERWHPLREEWVIVAAHRQNRPWLGETVGATRATVPPYVADCYLCPGNARIAGARNDPYDGIFIFDNDHPCVGWDAPSIWRNCRWMAPIETVPPAASPASSATARVTI